MTIAVLGAGMVGGVIARDLSSDHQVTAFDLDASNLDKLSGIDDSIKTVAADLSDTSD